MSTHFLTLLDELMRRSLRMASEVEDLVQEAGEAVFLTNESLARRVISRDAEVDQEEVAVESEVVRLMALYQPVGIDLRRLCTVLKVNSDLERIADCAVNMAERAYHLEVQSLAERKDELRQMVVVTRRLLSHAIEAYRSENIELAKQVRSGDDQIDELYARIVQQAVAETTASTQNIAAYLDLLSVAKNLERIADHATNIAEDVVFLSTGNIVRHQGDSSAS
jgi:phosphate transport system protein